MDIGPRDAFDLVLVAVALVLVYLHAIQTAGSQTAIGAVVEGLASINPIAYLVAVGVGGVLFMAYALLYVPAQSQR